MIYTIKNDKLTVTIDGFGAQIMSVKGGDCEYVWQGDPRFGQVAHPFSSPSMDRIASSATLKSDKSDSDGQIDDIAIKNYMFHIFPSKEKQIRYEMIFN